MNNDQLTTLILATIEKHAPSTTVAPPVVLAEADQPPLAELAPTVDPTPTAAELAHIDQQISNLALPQWIRPQLPPPAIVEPVAPAPPPIQAWHSLDTNPPQPITHPADWQQQEEDERAQRLIMQANAEFFTAKMNLLSDTNDPTPSQYPQPQQTPPTVEPVEQSPTTYWADTIIGPKTYAPPRPNRYNSLGYHFKPTRGLFNALQQSANNFDALMAHPGNVIYLPQWCSLRYYFPTETNTNDYTLSETTAPEILADFTLFPDSSRLYTYEETHPYTLLPTA